MWAPKKAPAWLQHLPTKITGDQSMIVGVLDELRRRDRLLAYVAKNRGGSVLHPVGDRTELDLGEATILDIPSWGLITKGIPLFGDYPRAPDFANPPPCDLLKPWAPRVLPAFLSYLSSAGNPPPSPKRLSCRHCSFAPAWRVLRL